MGGKLNRFSNLAVVLAVLANSTLAQDIPNSFLPGLGVNEFGLDSSELDQTYDTIAPLLEELNGRAGGPPTANELARLRSLEATLTSAFAPYITQIDRQLDAAVPPVLLEFGISLEFATRCRGFARALQNTSDDSTRAAILEENDFCLTRLEETQAALLEEWNQQHVRRNEIKSQIEALEARRDQLTQDEIDRIGDLQRELERVEERIEKLDSGKRWLEVLKLFLSFKKFAAGLAATIAGNPAAGIPAMASGLIGMKQAIDTIQGPPGRVAVPSNPGPVGDERMVGIRDLAEQQPAEASPEDYPEGIEGEPVTTASTGRFIMTADSLGTDAARLRFYSRANASTGPIFTLTPADITASQGANINNINMITRYSELPIRGPDGNRQVVLVLIAQIDDRETEFALQLLPRANGWIVMTERTER